MSNGKQQSDGLLVVALVLLYGCGGASSGQPKSYLPATGTLVANPTIVSPGQAVTLSWSSKIAIGVYESNFFSLSDQLTQNASIVLQPVVSESYEIFFSGAGPPFKAGPVIVTVSPTAQTYVVVGNSSTLHSQVASILSALATISTQPVIVQPTVPQAVVGDALILDPSATMSPADVSAVRAYLRAGKGVVLLAGSARLLATGDPTNPDVSAIASWFGGSSLQDASGAVNALAPTFVPVPITLVHSLTVDDIAGSYRFPSLNTGADPVAGVTPPFNGNPNEGYYCAFGYKPAIGGRVYWQTDAGFSKGPLLFSAGARWAATGP